MLTEQLTADAAALHQAILRHGGEVSPFFCGKELGWEHRRIARAMEELVAAGIIDPAAAVLPKPLKQRKTYDFTEIQAILADFPAFARAVHAVEHAAGRRLPTADLSALTELFDFHGLSPEALELLTTIAGQASLRYAMNMIITASLAAAKRKSNTVGVEDVKRVYGLFSDIGRSVKTLKEFQEDYLYSEVEWGVCLTGVEEGNESGKG